MPKNSFYRAILLTGLFFSLVMLPAGHVSAAEFMVEHPIPGAARNIVVEAPGRVWFTMPERSSIGLLVVSDTVTFQEFVTPTADSEPYDLAYADGAIWFTEYAANRIGRLDVASGAIAEYVIPTPDSGPTGIAVGSTGDVWFAQRNGNRLARLRSDMSGFAGSAKVVQTSSPERTHTQFETFLPVVAAQSSPIEEYVYGTPGAQFEDIAVGANQTVWATAPNLNQVVYLNARVPAPFFTYVFTTPYGRPLGITLDGDGVPWVAPYNANFLIRYAPGTLTFWRPYPIVTPQGSPTQIIFRKKGSLWEFWFTLNTANQAGQLTTQTNSAPVSLRQSPLPGSATQPWGIAIDAEDHVWVAAGDSNRIIEWVPPYFYLEHLPLVHQQ
ncbi:MAG TPA: hypothetical protein PKE45_01805 [Caldilineaceae bacterium]|nr:hypothetical protein [Caldilineaceae bacterium]